MRMYVYDWCMRSVVCVFWLSSVRLLCDLWCVCFYVQDVLDLCLICVRLICIMRATVVYVFCLKVFICAWMYYV